MDDVSRQHEADRTAGEAMGGRDSGGRRRRSRIITLFTKRRFEYSYLGSKAEQDVMIRRAQPIIPFYRYILMVRVHAVDMQNTGAQFRLRTFNTLPSRRGQASTAASALERGSGA